MLRVCQIITRVYMFREIYIYICIVLHSGYETRRGDDAHYSIIQRTLFAGVVVVGQKLANVTIKGVSPGRRRQ